MRPLPDLAEALCCIEHLGSPELPSPIAVASETSFIDDATRLFVDPHLGAVKRALANGEEPASFEVAGPRRRIYFDPARCRVAIVTCGGLSPGLNDVVRSLVLQLWERYGVRDILGVRNGYWGLDAASGPETQPLTPEDVRQIHKQGGTILGTSRGTPCTPDIVDTLEGLGVDILFVIGGDGTLRGARAICDEVARRGSSLAVVGLPKTIDNDIPFVRQSFGFDTAVALASQAVRSAHAEARSVKNGIGLVKLMGRHAGYIAANATLSSGAADFCLIPEVPFALGGPGGLFPLLESRLAERSHAVIVLAEGAGQHYFASEDLGVDASGNRKLGDIGVFLKQRLAAHFDRRKRSVAIKYIDPSYLIRSAPANPSDSLFCARLAQNAVHAAMAGKTAMLVGYWHGRMTHVPIRALEGRTKTVDPDGELWRNVLEATGQPPRIGPLPYPRPGNDASAAST